MALRKNHKVAYIVLAIVALADLLWIGSDFLFTAKSFQCNDLSFYQKDKEQMYVHPFYTDSCLVVVLPTNWHTDQLYVQDKENKSVPISIKLGTCYQLSNLISTSIKNISIKFVQSTQNTIFVQTKSGDMLAVDNSVDKSSKESGHIYIQNSTGKIEYDGALKTISGRGNWTWRRNKKPYNIKISEDAKIFDFGKSDSFCLLSNYSDYSNLRNWIALKLAQEIGMPNAIKSQFVSLWIDGEYRGLYLLTEKADIQKQSPEFNKLEKETQKLNGNLKKKDLTLRTYFEDGTSKDGETEEVGDFRGYVGLKNPTDITGSYLVETSQLDTKNEETGFRLKGEMGVDIKYPKQATIEQVGYLKDYFDEALNAVLDSTGFNPKTHRYYADYLDLLTFSKYYLLNEALLNVDGGLGSFKIYKNPNKVDSHLCAGPLWDFDMSMGRDDKEIYPEKNGKIRWPEWCFPTIPETLMMNADLIYKDKNVKFHGILQALSLHEDFMNLVKREYQNELKPLLNKYILGESFDSVYHAVQSDIVYDNYKNRLPIEYQMSKFSADALQKFMSRRINFLTKVWHDSLFNYHKITIDYGRNSSGYYRLMNVYVLDGEKLNLPIHAQTRLLNGVYDDNGNEVNLSTPIHQDMNIRMEWKQKTVNTDYWMKWFTEKKILLFQLLILAVCAFTSFIVYLKRR